MSIKLGDIAPNFKADSTEGPIDFHTWIGDSWTILMSHPADYTPVCTTELGKVANLKSEFDKRSVKAIAISVDPLDSHKGWINDINRTQNANVNFPLIADAAAIAGLTRCVLPSLPCLPSKFLFEVDAHLSLGFN